MEEAMNWDQIKGNWTQLKGKAREQWGELTDDELDQEWKKTDESNEMSPGQETESNDRRDEYRPMPCCPGARFDQVGPSELVDQVGCFREGRVGLAEERKEAKGLVDNESQPRQSPDQRKQ